MRSAGMNSSDRGRAKAVVLFDGVCHLCSRSVRYIIRRDPAGYFRFASLQSETAKSILASAAESGLKIPDSIVLVEGTRVYTESDAVLRIAARLKGPVSLARILVLIPKPLRDAIYRWVARRRYDWFGKMDSCMIPTPDLKERFLERFLH